jgi:hypothetical protein
VYPEFQRLNKTENCIVIQLKSDQKIAITSPVSFTLNYLQLYLSDRRRTRRFVTLFITKRKREALCVSELF